MPVDGSSYALQQPSTNALQSASGWMGMAQQGMQNKLLKLEVEQQQGIASLYKDAPKDQDGNIDLNWIQQNASRAGVGAPKAIKGAIDIQQQQTALKQALLSQDKSTLELGKNINDTIASSTVPLITDIQSSIKNGSYNADTTRGKLASEMATVIASSIGPDGKPVITPQKVMEHLSGVDFDNPQALIADLTNRLTQAKSMSGHLDEALQIKRGNLGSADVGTGTQPTKQSVFTGEVAPAGPVVPTGKSFVGGRPQYNKDIVSPSNPFSYQNPENPNAQGAPLPAGSNQGGTGPTPLPEAPPGYAENLGKGLDRANEAVQHANDITPLAAPLHGVLQMADAGGPKQQLYNNLKGALADNPILGGLFDNTKNDVAKFEILQKFASDVTGQNMSANAKNQIESAVQGLSNPNSSQFPLAIRTIGKFLLARTEAAKAYGNVMSGLVGDPNVTPAKITAAEKDWRDHYDQNLFELPYMTKDERHNLIGGMSEAGRKKFIKNGKYMVHEGLINPDDLQ